MNFALVSCLTVTYVLMFNWPCRPGTVTGRANGRIECVCLGKIEYDQERVVLICEDHKLRAECPIE